MNQLRHRLRNVISDERGVGHFATTLVVLLAVTAAACIGLLVDGGRITNANRQADQISFQAARSAAQQLDDNSLRAGELLVTNNASAAAATTVERLLAAAGLNGQMTAITVDQRRITVTVSIERTLTASALFGRSTVTVNGSGTARLGAGVTNEETPLP